MRSPANNHVFWGKKSTENLSELAITNILQNVRKVKQAMFKNNFFIPIRSGLVRFSRTYCLLVLNLNNKSRTCLALITKDKDNVSPSKQTIMRRLENYFSFIVYFMIILMASVNMSLAQAPDMENMHFLLNAYTKIQLSSSKSHEFRWSA